MAKKRAKKTARTVNPSKSPTARRIDVTEYGIDLPAIVAEIKQNIGDMTYAEVGAKAGMPRGSVANVFDGSVKPSLGAVAALAHATGGRLVVKYHARKQS
ncbi:MAG: helix-turn-helix transcriptional regulator [Phycisphaera sp. RhM]|nr:helix-turn-helix transcriptional regulator [Phycisphaera sp. RhM]